MYKVIGQILNGSSTVSLVPFVAAWGPRPGGAPRARPPVGIDIASVRRRRGRRGRAAGARNADIIAAVALLSAALVAHTHSQQCALPARGDGVRFVNCCTG